MDSRDWLVEMHFPMTLDKKVKVFSGINEADVRMQAEKQYPLWKITSIKEVNGAETTD